MKKLKFLVGKLDKKNFLTRRELDGLYDALYSALLDGDVSVEVAGEFVESIKQQISNIDIYSTSGVNKKFISYIEEELVKRLTVPTTERLFPKKEEALKIVFFIGLQGVGKTTSIAKLARLYKDKGLKPLLVAADLRRANAVDQIKLLSGRVEIDCFADYDEKDAVKLMQKARSYLKRQREKGIEYNVVLVDTSGRSTLDAELVNEIRDITSVQEDKLIYYVTDIYGARSSLNIAKQFNAIVPFDGVLITKADSDARGGVLLSITQGLKKPILYISDGESEYAFYKYSPEKFARQLIGGGNLDALLEQGNRVVGSTDEMEDILNSGELTFHDFLKYIKRLKKLGNISSMLRYIPGVSNVPNKELLDTTVNHIIYMINSMTPKERSVPSLVVKDKRRRVRIAMGCGLSISEVNRQIESFKKVNTLLKQLKKGDIGDINSLMRIMQ